MYRLAIFTLVLALVFAVGAAQAAVLYVDHTATGANDGTSWADAYTDLQSALAAMAAGDEVWVATGTYYPTATTNRDASFFLTGNNKLYGGFAGTETSLGQRDIDSNPTILSGNIGDPGTYVDNSYSVVRISVPDSNTVFDGFTVRDGNAGEDFIFVERYMGGGMVILRSGTSGAVKVSNVIFCDNRAGRGGAVYVEPWTGSGHNGAADFQNVAFYNNSVTAEYAMGWGGAIYTIDSDITITGARFYGGSAEYGGGACFEGGSVSLYNAEFHDNSAILGGGLNTYLCSAFVANTTFYGNTATTGGGGIFSNQASLSLVNIIMWDDSAPSEPEIKYGTIPPEISYSLVAGCGGSGGGWNPAIGSDGGGNLDTDPLYVDPLTGDLRLDGSSPAIDAGNSAAPGLPATDIAGDPRIYGVDVDMGAYEYSVAGKSSTVVIDKTGSEIYFISDLDTLAVMNFTSEDLDSARVVQVKQAPPNIKEGSDWVKVHYEITAFPEDADFETLLKLFYDQEDFDCSGISDESLLQLWRYDEPTAKWEYKESNGDIDKNSLTAIDVTKFSVWGITDSKNAVDVEEDNIMPKAYVLHQNRPNPFNPSTVIEYQLPSSQHVQLSIYNVLGQRVITLVDEPQTAGFKSVRWNGFDQSGASVASGVYFYRLRAGAFTEARKMILLR